MSQALNNKLLWLIIVLSLIGFADSTYLTIEHFSGSVPSCSVTQGCGEVLTSKYSAIFGIPVALFGAVYYLFVFFAFMYTKDTENSGLMKFASIFTTAGLIASGYFVFIQFVVIKSICQYCMLSVATSTLIFILGMTILKQMKQNESNSKLRPTE